MATNEVVQAFNLNILRLKNFRMRMGRAYGREADALQKTIDALKRQHEALVQHKQNDPITRGYYDPVLRADLYSYLSWAFHWQQQLENLPGEAVLGREMAFVYLVAIFDAFIGEWLVEINLHEADRLPAASPQLIRSACEKLAMPVNFPADFNQRLGEMRARRNVLVHRGGIADEEYCENTGRREVLNQRLEITDRYLDEAEEFIAEFVWTEIVPKSPQEP